MNINTSAYTISELIDRLDRKEVKINRDYQRGEGVWPLSAKSYFIDTILEEYPFPKLYFYQIYDKARKKPVMEVIDGQQRLFTINEFLKGELKLTSSSKVYSGKCFEDLSEEDQQKFRMTRVPVDVVLAAERPKLLEMFRRMNAYTAPLNASEKRHSRFQGKFKWFAVELADEISPVLSEFNILTSKQMIRMADSELIAELCIALRSGIINKSESELEKIYRELDQDFPESEKYRNLIVSFFDYVRDNLSEIRSPYLMKPYAIHSLFCAFSHIKVGIPNGDADLGIPCRKKPPLANAQVISDLQEISDAHETKNLTGRFGDYVNASLSTTTKRAQRIARTKTFINTIDPS
jgi:hypothetical protein